MTLGGILFIRNGEQFDYCYMQAIESLICVCEKVVILDAGSDDGTAERLDVFGSDKITVIKLSKEDWDKQHGREKLSYFQNMALAFLDTDYYFLLQGDEVIHEKCFHTIKRLVQTGTEAFYVTRRNLWKDCNHELFVPQERKPCSTEVIRLAKTKYKSVDDGESIAAPASAQFLYDLEIWHYGFVRKKEVMKDKIFNMQENVFEIPHDPKLDNMAEFDWSAWFSETDLKKITEPHPIFIQEWIKTRP